MHLLLCGQHRMLKLFVMKNVAMQYAMVHSLLCGQHTMLRLFPMVNWPSSLN